MLAQCTIRQVSNGFIVEATKDGEAQASIHTTVDSLVDSIRALAGGPAAKQETADFNGLAYPSPAENLAPAKDPVSGPSPAAKQTSAKAAQQTTPATGAAASAAGSDDLFQAPAKSYTTEEVRAALTKHSEKVKAANLAKGMDDNAASIATASTMRELIKAHGKAPKFSEVKPENYAALVAALGG